MEKVKKKMSKITKDVNCNGESSNFWLDGKGSGLFNLKILHCNYCRNISWWHYSLHSVPFWYLWRSKQTGAVLEVNGVHIELNPEQIVLLPPCTPFTTDETANFDQYHVHFELAGLERVFPRRPIILPDLDNKMFFSQLDKYNVDWTKATLFAYNQVISALMRIPENLLKQLPEQEMDSRIVKALEIMQHQLPVLPSISDISRQIGMSENNFLRKFRMELKVSPKQYMLGLRITLCMEQLKSSKMSLKEIATNGGFADRYHFSKTFKRFTGCSPGKIRRELEKNFKL